MKRLDMIASRIVLATSLKDILKTLTDLDDLSSNIDDMVDMFGRHFKIAARIDTDVDTQFELLQKAKNGLKAAENAQKSLESVLKAYPDDKTALRAIRDAVVMVKRFEKHEKDARKVISTISKKEMPPALVKYANGIARAMRARLVNPKALRVVPWQQKGFRSGVEYQVALILDTDGFSRQNTYRVLATVSTESTDAPKIYGQDGKQTPKMVADRMSENLRGWTGLKGEDDAIAGREETARGVQSAINSAIRRMRPYDEEAAEVETGNASVHASYRSNSLPKDGAQAVGENRYDDMVDDEIKSFKKQLEPLLKSYSKAIKNVSYYDGEKSWIYVDVNLK